MMRNSAMLLTVCFSLGFTFAQQPASSATDNRFDGVWDATISCPNEIGGARGYTYQFVAEVKDGVLRAQHRVPDSAGSLRIEGKIPSDGAAELHAYGRTGNPDYAVKKPTEGTPYSYRIKAKFEGTRGSGDRLDSRPCSFLFSKR